jgi:AcrR family transcriptional regulator
MPKKSRSSEEIETVKQKIMEEALALISEYGFDGFSMRSLAARLDITAKTIYNYYKSKDEIYLGVLTRGFELIVADLLASINGHSDPYEKLRALKNAYIEFGTKQSNYYDIMFTLYIPKYNDYVGTQLEGLASVELKTALQIVHIFTDVIKEVAKVYGCIPENEARSYFVQLLTSLHGLVATYNNAILGYLEKSPRKALDAMSERLLLAYFPMNAD